MGGPRHGPDMQNLHRNKRSMTLNLKLPQAREVLERLVKTADVVVENYRPDVKHRLGIDYESLSKMNPRQSSSPASPASVRRAVPRPPRLRPDRAGHERAMSVTGLPGQGPVRTGAAIADLAADHVRGARRQGRRFERETSGKGQWVQSSLLQAGLRCSTSPGGTLLEGRECRRRWATIIRPACRPRPTRRRTAISTSPLRAKTWASLCKALERDDMLQSSEFKGAQKRAENRKKLNVEIEKTLVGKTSAEWIQIMNKAGVPQRPDLQRRRSVLRPAGPASGIATEVEHAKLAVFACPAGRAPFAHPGDGARADAGDR